MSETVHYICHPEVVIDPKVLVPDWGLSDTGFRRMHAIAAMDAVSSVQSVWCSDEQKALDGAGVLAGKLGITHHVLPELGENDRSSTGYLPAEDFEPVVDSFFGEPDRSVRGWETATHAQERIVAAMRRVCRDSVAGDIAVVAHGGVGNLLNCHIRKLPISREYAALGMGSWFSFDRDSWALQSDWQIPPELV